MSAAVIDLLADRILVIRVDRGEDVTKGGIHVPDQAHELGDCAEVVAVGPGARRKGSFEDREPLEVEVGQTIIINRYAGTEVEIDGVPHLILKDDDVLAVVEETS